MNNKNSFYSFAIIVWQGVICQYGSISHLINDDDDIRVATDFEVKSYQKANL